MRRKAIIAIGIISCLAVLTWSPWITEDYALNRVVEHLGGNEAKFNYLGDEMEVGDIPKTFIRYPFAQAVYFPGEAVFFVTFFGGIL